jgi:hypothetical protein
MSDDILRQVLAEIHRTEVKPPRGFMTISAWRVKWKCSTRNAKAYMDIAMKKGLLVRRPYRVRLKKRLQVVPMYGPPPSKK